MYVKISIIEVSKKKKCQVFEQDDLDSINAKMSAQFLQEPLKDPKDACIPHLAMQNPWLGSKTGGEEAPICSLMSLYCLGFYPMHDFQIQ